MILSQTQNRNRNAWYAQASIELLRRFLPTVATAEEGWSAPRSVLDDGVGRRRGAISNEHALGIARMSEAPKTIDQNDPRILVESLGQGSDDAWRNRGRVHSVV